MTGQIGNLCKCREGIGHHRNVKENFIIKFSLVLLFHKEKRWEQSEMLGPRADGATARLWRVKLPATLAAAPFVQDQV